LPSPPSETGTVVDDSIVVLVVSFVVSLDDLDVLVVFFGSDVVDDGFIVVVVSGGSIRNK
jgi:hypothetical protein